jgi:formylglycine-generating enzyme required for sulfatase activity
MYADSVFEVTSCDRVSNLSAGTAFAVDRAGSTAYLVTCAHVIKAVGRDQVCVEGLPARVEALGDPEGPDDLAVLSAELPRARPLRLSPSSPDGGEILVVGYTPVVGGATVARSHGGLGELTVMRSIPGRLQERTQVQSRGRPAVPVWMLSTSEDLTEGISGGPVIDGDSREVVGVASLSWFGQGRAIAIAVGALDKLWPAGTDRLRGARSVRGIEFVPVPGGTFPMGTSEGRAAELAQLKTAGNFLSEKPAAPVSIPGYYISRHVITNSQYAEFTGATGHRVPQAQDSMSQDVSWHPLTRRPPEGMDDYPVVLVSWHDAAAYCAWLGGRLPTEAEWEKAARGTNGREWPWGDQWDPARCNTAEGRPVPGLMPVGRFSPAGDSPYQVADMSGNIWEWCASVMKPYPYRPDRDRESEAALGERVIRGGAWGEGRYRCRCASRNATRPDDLGFTIGFRVVLDVGSELLFQADRS